MSEKELYALWWGTKKCRHFLYERHFTVQTDLQSLAHLTKSLKDFDNQRVVRCLDRPLQYDFTGRHIKGITKVVPEAVSRRPTGQPLCTATALICEDSRSLSTLRYFMPWTRMQQPFVLNSTMADELSTTVSTRSALVRQAA